MPEEPEPEQPVQQPERARPRRWSGPVTLLVMLAIPLATYLVVLLDGGGADEAPPTPTAPPAVSTPAPPSGPVPTRPSP